MPKIIPENKRMAIVKMLFNVGLHGDMKLVKNAALYIGKSKFL